MPEYDTRGVKWKTLNIAKGEHFLWKFYGIIAYLQTELICPKNFQKGLLFKNSLILKCM